MDQDQSCLDSIATEWRKLSKELNDEQEIKLRFNEVLLCEDDKRTEEFWAILLPCVSLRPEDRGTMTDVVRKLEEYRPDLKQAA